MEQSTVEDAAVLSRGCSICEKCCRYKVRSSQFDKYSYVIKLFKDDIHFPIFKTSPTICHMPGFRPTPAQGFKYTQQPTNHDCRWQKWYHRIPPKWKSLAPTRRITTRDNPPIKRICFWGRLIGPMALKMLRLCGGASSPQQNKHFEGHIPYNPQPKPYLLDQGVFLDHSNVSDWDAGHPVRL